MKEPLVSIVIPVYNGGDFLREAIDSALAQSYGNTEVLVVDDGSNDGGRTRSIALSYGERIRYLAKPNGGVSSALNEGIRGMRGQFFSWLSHDDLYLPDKVESQVRLYRGLDDPRSVVYCDQMRIDASGALLEEQPAHPAVDDTRFLYSILKSRWMGGCTLLIPRRAFEECGVFDESLKTVQDYHLWYRFILGGYRFVHNAQVGVYSRVHRGQDSRRKKDLHASEKEQLFSWVADTFPARLICAGIDDRAVALLNLALSYKQQRLAEAYKRFLSLAVENLTIKRPAAYLALIRAVLWNRSAAAAWKKLKRAVARSSRGRRSRAVDLR